ncbi:MAG TPA: IS110 family transposase [Ignavibacteria bacterium]|nr:IS110 family transposase [Ignavibacteria bacterium]HMR39640.1 IS110 family transposase [Ignavibacteria bacterium]HMR41239.1 IS110 family transposase [Ignavibacteria bacterium]
MKLIKKVTGIDISKDSITVCFGTLDDSLIQRFSKSFTFSNDVKGFKKLIKSVNNIDVFRSEDKNIPLWFVVEATGVYYENLAYFLTENKYSVSVVLPNKIKAFLKTLENKSKTDNLDSAGIAQFGLEKTLNKWEPPTALYKELKELTRELLSTTEMMSQLKNKLHAKKHSHEANTQTIKRIENQIEFFEKQIKLIKEQIEELVKSDKDLDDRVKKITTAQGVGFITAITVISETNGFSMIENQRQLTSYAGYDPRQNTSGIFKGKTPISKKGNKYLRAAVYLPALSAARWNEHLKRVYKRLCISKNNKKIALVAVARKLLILIYTLWKKNEKFNVNYKHC